MSDEQVAYFRELFSKLDIPTLDAITEEAQAIYQQGCDILLLYRGDPNILLQGLQAFMATGVRPYVYAGAAQVMIAAAYIGGGTYHQPGLDQAEILLRQAQKYASK